MTEFFSPARTLPKPSIDRRILCSILLLAFVLYAGFHATSASAQGLLNISPQTVQKRANGVLSLMAYSVVPDLASSSLAIQDSSSHDTTINMV